MGPRLAMARRAGDPGASRPPGDGAAGGRLEALFREFAPRVYRLALRCGLDPEEAEDGVQEVFLKVQRRLDTFRGEAALSTWLYQVALRTLLDHRRRVLRQTRARGLGGEEEHLAAGPGGGSAPAEEAIRSERQRLVRQAMARLPRRHREVLVLRELEGLAYRDIARILGVAQGTVESRLFRARERLARELRRLHGEEI